MTNESPADCRRLETCLWAVVFLGLFVYAWKGIESHLLYYGFGVFTAYPFFSWEGPFLRTAVAGPAGMLETLAAVLAQAYRNPLPGALVIAATAAALSAGIRRLLHSVRADRLGDLAWLPAILVLMIYSRYDDPLPFVLAVGLSAWMAVLHGSIPMKTVPGRLGVFLILFAVAYCLWGASALVFACGVCLIEALLHRRIMVAAAQAVIAGGGVFVLGRFVFGLAPRAAYAVGTSWDLAHKVDSSTLSSLLTAVLYAFIPALILTVFVGRALTALRDKTRRSRGERPEAKNGHSARGASRRSSRDAGRSGRPKARACLTIGLRLLVTTVTAILCLALSRNHIRYERMLHYWTCRRDWGRVIALAHQMQGRQAFTRSGVFDINRALAHEGRLGDELCAYPQDETKTLFLSFDDMAGRFQHAKLLELYLDLGCPNAAEKNAYELLDNEGPSPHVLESLVRIHLVKGQYESARIARRALQKYVGCRGQARQWQEIVADPARAEDHPLIRAWRRVRSAEDDAVKGVSFEPMLKRLLQETPDHRLAFEYLMAHYLLKHQRAEFVSCLPLLRLLGYSRLPRQYAEAVLVHSLETRTSPNTLGWTIEPQVYAQFQETTGVVRNARGDNQAVFDALAPKYGDTYTFYSMFNVCGAK